METKGRQYTRVGELVARVCLFFFHLFFLSSTENDAPANREVPLEYITENHEFSNYARNYGLASAKRFSSIAVFRTGPFVARIKYARRHAMCM